MPPLTMLPYRYTLAERQAFATGAFLNEIKKLQAARDRQPSAAPRDPDDGLWLFAGAVGGRAETADLSDLDLRVRDRAAGQGPVRHHRRKARGARRRRGRAGLLPLQQSELRNSRGPHRGVGR